MSQFCVSLNRLYISFSIHLPFTHSLSYFLSLSLPLSFYTVCSLFIYNGPYIKLTYTYYLPPFYSTSFFFSLSLSYHFYLPLSLSLLPLLSPSLSFPLLLHISLSYLYLILWNKKIYLSCSKPSFCSHQGEERERDM